MRDERAILADLITAVDQSRRLHIELREYRLRKSGVEVRVNSLVRRKRDGAEFVVTNITNHSKNLFGIHGMRAPVAGRRLKARSGYVGMSDAIEVVRRDYFA